MEPLGRPTPEMWGCRKPPVAPGGFRWPTMPWAIPAGPFWQSIAERTADTRSLRHGSLSFLARSQKAHDGSCSDVNMDQSFTLVLTSLQGS